MQSHVCMYTYVYSRNISLCRYYTRRSKCIKFVKKREKQHEERSHSNKNKEKREINKKAIKQAGKQADIQKQQQQKQPRHNETDLTQHVRYLILHKTCVHIYRPKSCAAAAAATAAATVSHPTKITRN